MELNEKMQVVNVELKRGRTPQTGVSIHRSTVLLRKFCNIATFEYQDWTERDYLPTVASLKRVERLVNEHLQIDEVLIGKGYLNIVFYDPKLEDKIKENNNAS